MAELKLYKEKNNNTSTKSSTNFTYLYNIYNPNTMEILPSSPLFDYYTTITKPFNFYNYNVIIEPP